MTVFAVDRFEANRGYGDGSGQWVFEEFMFTDSILGTAVVNYEATLFRHDVDDRPERKTERELRIFNPHVTRIEVFDDDGKTVELSVEDRKNLCLQVLQAFANVSEDVIDHECGCL